MTKFSWCRHFIYAVTDSINVVETVFMEEQENDWRSRARSSHHQHPHVFGDLQAGIVADRRRNSMVERPTAGIVGEYIEFG